MIRTYNVFEAARLAGVKRVVFASSGAAVSRHELDWPYGNWLQVLIGRCRPTGRCSPIAPRCGVQHISNLKTPIGEVLQAAASEGVLLEAGGETRYALIPLDDDLLDYLIERNPRFMSECQRIRERMASGQFHTHEEVTRLLTGD